MPVNPEIAGIEFIRRHILWDKNDYARPNTLGRAYADDVEARQTGFRAAGDMDAAQEGKA